MDCWILYTRKRKLKPPNNIQLPLAAPVGPGDGGGADLVGGVAAGSQHAVPGEEDDVAAAVRGNGLAAPLAVVRPLQLMIRTFSTIGITSMKFWGKILNLKWQVFPICSSKPCGKSLSLSFHLGFPLR